MNVLDLANLDWELFGWRPFSWMLFRSLETGQTLEAELGPFPARAPGSVQQALRDAGVLPDWNVGTQSRECAWVEHYHWQFHTEIPDTDLPRTSPILLEAMGLDYSGWVYFDGREVGQFKGTFLPHRFDLTPVIEQRAVHTLDILFDTPPPEQGQIGFTSRSRYFKPRFAYGWDWCPRLVPVGVWDRLAIRAGLEATLEVSDLTASLDADNRTGHVELTVGMSTPLESVACLQADLVDGERILASAEAVPLGERTSMVLSCPEVRPWWPNGSPSNPDGRATVYRLVVRALDAGGNPLWRDEERVGFKRIEWRPCEGAPPDALPWVCVVNGEATFLQGVNWSPVRLLYPDTRDEEYAQLVEVYREMGCNCFRVNGVGLLEKEVFYELCDAAGILVWQDFPLSSSGVDNWPPEDPQAVADITEIAESIVLRRRRHPSLLLWCGGNELQSGPEGEKTGGGKPAPADHPCLAALRRVVERLDPGRRFLPTTAFGPLFYAQRENFGKGLHHLVHGPWGMSTFSSLEDWCGYWENDDSLFRAEVGMPGAAPSALIRRYAGDLPAWPCLGPLWKHSCAWWIQWDRLKSECEGLTEPEALERYCELTECEQAEALASAARACKTRFPACGGFLIWHGHDCFPCPINNSLIDFERKPKPVYSALEEVFRRTSAGERPRLDRD